MLFLLTSATGEPVTVEEVKSHLRLETTNDDELIDGLIPVARLNAENYMKRQIMPATYKLILPNFPNDTAVIELPRPPLSTASSNVSVQYYLDTTIVDDATTIPSTVYTVDYQREPGCIYPIYDNEWPSCVTDYKKDAVQITYKTGYLNRSKVPEPIKHFIKMFVGSLYENREPLYEGRFMNQLQPLDRAFYHGLLDPYVIIKIT